MAGPNSFENSLLLKKNSNTWIHAFWQGEEQMQDVTVFLQYKFGKFKTVSFEFFYYTSSVVRVVKYAFFDSSSSICDTQRTSKNISGAFSPLLWTYSYLRTEGTLNWVITPTFFLMAMGIRKKRFIVHILVQRNETTAELHQAYWCRHFWDLHFTQPKPFKTKAYSSSYLIV